MLRAWGTSRTSSPLRMGRAPDPPPTDCLCLPHLVAGQPSPVQSRLPCAQCCAVLRCAAFCSVSVSLSTTPPDFLLLNLRLLLGTTDEPVARRHSPSPIRVPVRGHADDKVFLEPIDSTSPSPLQSPSSLQQPASQTVSITSLRNTQCSIPATGAVTSQTPHTDLASIVHRPPSLRLHRPSVLFSTPASHTKKLTTSNKSSSSLSQPSHAVVAPRVWVSFPARPGSWLVPMARHRHASSHGVFSRSPFLPPEPRPNIPRRPLSASVFSTSLCHHAAASKNIGPTWLDIHFIQLDIHIQPDCPLTYANESSRNWETVVSAHRVGRPRQPRRHSCCLAVQRQPPRPPWLPTRPTSLVYTTGSGKKSERDHLVSFLRGPTSSTTSRLPSNSSVYP